jgi:hypothetical protein
MVKRSSGRGGKSDNTLWIIGGIAVAAAVIFYVYHQASTGLRAASTGAAANKSGVVAKCVGSSGCGHSQKQKAEMPAIKAKVGDKATVEYHDAASEQGKKLAAENKIAGVPTCVVYKHGSKVGEWSGFMEADHFLKKLDSYL